MKMKCKFFNVINILFYWFLFFTIISAIFYIISLTSDDFIFRYGARRWLIINAILTLITGGYKFYKNYCD